MTINKKTSETALVMAIRDALLATGKVQLYRNNVGRMKTGVRWISFGLGLGSPDLVGFLRPGGRFVGVEVKLPGLALEPAQIVWHKAARDSGALVYVAHSVDEALAGLRDPWLDEAILRGTGADARERVRSLVARGLLTEAQSDALLDGIA